MKKLFDDEELKTFSTLFIDNDDECVCNDGVSPLIKLQIENDAYTVDLFLDYGRARLLMDEISNFLYRCVDNVE